MWHKVSKFVLMFPLCDEVITSTNRAQAQMFLVRFECRPAVGNNCALLLYKTTEPSVSLPLRPGMKTWNLHTEEKQNLIKKQQHISRMNEMTCKIW